MLAPGAYADINVIDLDGSNVPGTFAVATRRGVSLAEVFMESGQHTGALAGALLRSGPDER